MFYVYIIQSLKDQSYYKGYTSDLKNQLSKHNKQAQIYTAKKAPYKLVWYCAFSNQKKALAFEKYLKQGSGFAFAKKHLI